MKHAVVALAGALILASTVSATAQGRRIVGEFYEPGPYQDINVKRTVINYKHCLESPNQGILESSLGHVILLRLVRPDADLTPLKESIMRLAAEGPTCCVRYRASLAAMVFDSPGTFTGVASIPYASGNELFSNVAAKAEVMLLTDNR